MNKSNVKKNAKNRQKLSLLDRVIKVWDRTKEQDIVTKASIIMLVFSIASLLVFCFTLIATSILPISYLVIIFGVVGIIYVWVIYFMFSKFYSIKVRRLAQVLSGLVAIILAVVGFNVNALGHLFLEVQVGDTEKVLYSVIVTKDNKFFTNIMYINSDIGIVKDENAEAVKTTLDSEMKKAGDAISFEVRDHPYVENESVYELANKLLNKETYVICIDQAHLDLLNQTIEGFQDQTKIIRNFEIEIPTYKIGSNVPDSDSFIAYIAGIDQGSLMDSERGQSYINILLAVNPKTHKVLIVKTPPNYYLQLSGIAGGNDRLSDAGIYGIAESVKTLENLYGVEIDYYFRTNFREFAPVIDAIGGIDINSDMQYIANYDGNEVYINKGLNHFNGEEALVYARGDSDSVNNVEQRYQNQLQIINAVMEKITASNTLIIDYNPILTTVGNAFRTDMSASKLTSLVREQVFDFPNWQVEEYSVTGTEERRSIYSMGPNYEFDVMVPQEVSVNVAKDKIKNIMNDTAEE